MGIIGEHPESGLRIDIAREREGGPPWRYTGEAVTPEARMAMQAVVEADGTVTVELAEPSPAVAEKARLIVRAAFKHAKEADEHAAPPRRIQRWRAEPIS